MPPKPRVTKKTFKTKKSVEGLIADPKKFLSALTNDERKTLWSSLRNAFFNTNAPLVSDNIYDLIGELYPELGGDDDDDDDDVGAPIPDGDSRKAKLPIWMGSLDKIKSDPKQLDIWKTKYGCEKSKYILSDKLDGVSALLVIGQAAVGEPAYSLFTRGDGSVGQNITHLVAMVNGFPSVKTLSSIPKGCMIRGELVMMKADFDEERGSNARNLVSGLVNAKKPDSDVARVVVFMAYEFRMPVNGSVTDISPSEQFKKLREYGFRCPWHEQGNVADLDFETLSQNLSLRRQESDFVIDGLVVAHDGVHPHLHGKNPGHAFAFKFLISQETAEVIVSQVVWKTSKDGYMKPTVEFEAVRLSGVNIKRATGFNAEYIKNNCVGPGARLLVTRSGDVIPYIMRVIDGAANGKPQLPDQLAPPNLPWIWKGKDIKITGQSDEHDLRLLVLFFDSLDIKGVSKGTVTKIFEAGFNSVSSVLRMTEAQVVAIPSMQNRGSLAAEVKTKATSISCIQLMKASNAFGAGFGDRKLKSIVSAIPSLVQQDKVPSIDQLVAIDGVSDITAAKFIEGYAKFKVWLKETGLKKGCQATKSATTATDKGQKELQPQPIHVSKHAKLLKDAVVVFSGFRNAEWEKIIEAAGGRVATSISSKTTLVVVKDTESTSAKVKAAESMGTRVISGPTFEKEFVK